MNMGERDWYGRYRAARDYADEQAEAYKRGDEIDNWTYETDYKPDMPKPRKLRLTGAGWVAYAYEIAAENATTLTQIEGKRWQFLVDECEHLAQEYREKARSS
jgi:hypothetical protein